MLKEFSKTAIPNEMKTHNKLPFEQLYTVTHIGIVMIKYGCRHDLTFCIHARGRLIILSYYLDDLQQLNLGFNYI